MMIEYSKKTNKNNIKYLVMDVDGTLTDGKIYMGQSGEAMKAFSIKDGYGINGILGSHSITPIIITGRCSTIVSNRCKELHINEIHQGITNKYEKLIEIISRLSANDKKRDVSLKSVAVIGDDIPDLSMMIPVKDAGGIIGCPLDAVDKVKGVSDFIASHNGGEGAVRDFIDWLCYNQ